jgi:hypothetical protein
MRRGNLVRRWFSTLKKAAIVIQRCWRDCSRKKAERRKNPKNQLPKNLKVCLHWETNCCPPSNFLPSYTKLKNIMIRNFFPTCSLYNIISTSRSSNSGRWEHFQAACLWSLNDDIDVQDYYFIVKRRYTTRGLTPPSYGNSCPVNT